MAISVRLNIRRRTAVATATGLPRYARNNKVGTHEVPRAIAFYRHLIPKTPKPFVVSLSKDKNLPSYDRI